MLLDAKIPGGPLTGKWDRHRFEMKLVNPANKKKNLTLSLLEPAWQVQAHLPHLPNSGTMLRHFVYRTVLAGPTVLLHRGESTRQRTIQMKATVYGDFFMTPSKGVISGQGKPMCTVLHR